LRKAAIDVVKFVSYSRTYNRATVYAIHSTSLLSTPSS